jgi:hypothetical protein
VNEPSSCFLQAIFDGVRLLWPIDAESAHHRVFFTQKA